MEFVSEQQLPVKLRIAPKDFLEMTEEEQMAFVEQLAAERKAGPVKKPRKPKDPNAPPARGRKIAGPVDTDSDF